MQLCPTCPCHSLGLHDLNYLILFAAPATSTSLLAHDTVLEVSSFATWPQSHH